jgi:hypothetical protein
MKIVRTDQHNVRYGIIFKKIFDRCRIIKILWSAVPVQLPTVPVTILWAFRLRLFGYAPRKYL